MDFLLFVVDVRMNGNRNGKENKGLQAVEVPRDAKEKKRGLKPARGGREGAENRAHGTPRVARGNRIYPLDFNGLADVLGWPGFPGPGLPICG